MHEVITLQLGQRANFTATHFWNLQESYFTYSEKDEAHINHNVHFRAGVGADGSDTFMPRTLIYDLKGGFGSLRRFNALYDIQEDSGPIRGLWDGTTTTRHQPPIEPTQYQKNLDEGLPTFQLRDNDVRYWSDFNRVFYHPRSIVQLNEYELNSQLMPFENWSTGEELYRSLNREFDVLDRDFRPFAEECDQLQAIQVFAGTDDAWGGFASQYVDSLRDEFGKTSIWVWGLEDGRRKLRQQQIVQSTNAARSLRAICQQASAYARLSTLPPRLPSYVQLQSNSEWISAGLICSAIETATLPTRLATAGGRQGSFPLFEAVLNTNGQQNILEVQASLPYGREMMRDRQETDSGFNERGSPTRSKRDVLPKNEELRSSDIQYTPFVDLKPLSSDQHVFALVESNRSAIEAQSNPDNEDDRADRLRRRLEEERIIECFDSRQPFPMLDTFPDSLFSTTRSGSNSISLRAGLLSTTRTKDDIICLRNMTTRSFDFDERENIYSDLTAMAEAYSYGWSEGSDSDHDE